MNLVGFAADLRPVYDEAARYCKALCANWSPTDSEDVFQSALLKAFENYDSLREKESFKSWLFKIITNTYYSATRRSFWNRFSSLNLVPPIEQYSDQNERTNQLENNWLIHTALAALSAKERVAILLFHLEGFSIGEITQIQNEHSHSAVKSRLSRARRKLREEVVRLESDASEHLHEINKNEFESESHEAEESR